MPPGNGRPKLSEKGLLTPDNCVVTLIDHQPQMLFGVANFDRQAIINNVCGHTAPGGIVLMHDGGGMRQNTVVALRTILPNLSGRFTLIPLPTS